ncbi:hypothetical protein [Peribacillus sp. NPDC097895]|uniref:hypothetical protein n=1 Tax=Peribacillus sp. NPDC097895 TaxID=3390619 RepID=UPI003D04A558
MIVWLSLNSPETWHREKANQSGDLYFHNGKEKWSIKRVCDLFAGESMKYRSVTDKVLIYYADMLVLVILKYKRSAFIGLNIKPKNVDIQVLLGR